MSTATTTEPSASWQRPPHAAQVAGRVRCRLSHAGACAVPVDLAVPLPPGRCASDIELRLADHWKIPVQTRLLATWPDGSARWLLASFLLPPLDGPSVDLELTSAEPREATGWVSQDSGGILVQAAGQSYRVERGSSRLFGQARLLWTTPDGRSPTGRVEDVQIEEQGPVRTTIRTSGRFQRGLAARFTARLSFFAQLPLVRLEIQVENPRRARHRGGYWDLGDPGSLLVRDFSMVVDLPPPASRTIVWKTAAESPLQESSGQRLEIYQDSSGGENWQSPNHVNRHGQVPLQFRGFRVGTDREETGGERANPVVAVADRSGAIACAVEEFWQKFPTAIEVDGNQLHIRLWPGQSADLHELQAGEHNTRVVWLDFSPDAQSACQRLTELLDPPRLSVDPEWIADSRAVRHFPSPWLADRPEFQSLRNEAVEGQRNFLARREAIDEYGWRNYGDMWADHEGAYSDDPPPVISHYNNQYDLLHSLLVEYLRSGESRWWKLADPLARHVMDIDIYHTSRDKPAYNGGLFWHTAHYHAVGRSTHRSMSQAMRGKRIPAPGTGPCNEHNYSAGLLLYYCLTGSPKARETVISLADWVLRMDAGRQHPLGVLSQRPTGDATRTLEPEYHGPGRGAGNSIHSLLNGWTLTGDDAYLSKSIEIIQRTVHPQDNLAARHLDEAELRWSYTIYLQALVHFLEATAHRHDLLEIRRYGVDSLLHYARWMVDNERFYLDEPEKLEYPTETWAAQELRKGTTLLMAARYARASEAERFRRRAGEILDRAWQTLLSFESRTCTRPLAIALQQGYLETFLKREISIAENLPDEASPSPLRAPPQPFVSQKQEVKVALRSPAAWPQLLRSAVHAAGWMTAWRQTWLAERVRRWWD